MSGKFKPEYFLDSPTAARLEMDRISNTAVLLFVMGYQGGTVHQVAGELGVEVDYIINANATEMGELCRKAQAYQWNKNGGGDAKSLLIKHLQVCVNNLKIDYKGHDIPSWLERADGVLRILTEN